LPSKHVTFSHVNRFHRGSPKYLGLRTDFVAFTCSQINSHYIPASYVLVFLRRPKFTSSIISDFDTRITYQNEDRTAKQTSEESIFTHR